jgi:hypothetical protein
MRFDFIYLLNLRLKLGQDIVKFGQDIVEFGQDMVEI